MRLLTPVIPVLLIAALGACVSGGRPISEARIAAAIDGPARTDQDRALDASRRPAAFLEFLALRNNAVVAEINAGGGYNARLLAGAVGRHGKVYVTNADFVLTTFDGLDARLRQSLIGVPNAEIINQGDTTLDLPQPVDVAILNNNYHDLHWQQIDTAAFNRAVFNAVRPGGHFVVGDHHATAGSDARDAGTLHRIDRALVVREVEAAGFRLVDEARFLANPADDRTLFVVDPAIRGKTDRFLLKFQRPG